ncbi:ABC transporter substrate-binding protein [Amorphus orientalis]|uniref:Branched-chain amino acid transport system substrate-binding protein n=1 Tax=Amorphus orientalis TaxID=649198 RepID=A0AAE3VME4_9HYPH|nr:ABC transporter substrate-binding protein [Amorphus orientalis]MDQ0314716.1 branched-chain amino acid transport system substrate-binding protein [Amorphus orientalis]
MKRIVTRIAATAAVVLMGTGAGLAQDTVKVGLVGEMSGPFAQFGEQFLGGLKAYQAINGTEAGGKTVEVIIKDVGGPNPDVAKRLAQELIVRDKVDVLTGFGFTPNAAAVAPIATEAKVPMVIMNAAAEGLTQASDYMVRVSFSLPSLVPPMAEWLVEQGHKKAYLIVGDYRPGHDVEKAFLEAFPAAGGEVVGNVRTPLMTVDFAPYMQKVKDTQPDAIFAFVNAGDVMASFLKAYREKGLDEDEIVMAGTGDITFEPSMPAVGDAAEGIVTSYNYSMMHDSELNKRFVEEFHKAAGADVDPSIMGVGGYDAMALIYAALEKTGGDTDGTALVEAMKGMEWESPRGPISIDPETRDIVQNIYLRKVEQVGDKFGNVEFETIEPSQQ